MAARSDGPGDTIGSISSGGIGDTPASTPVAADPRRDTAGPAAPAPAAAGAGAARTPVLCILRAMTAGRYNDEVSKLLDTDASMLLKNKKALRSAFTTMLRGNINLQLDIPVSDSGEGPVIKNEDLYHALRKALIEKLAQEMQETMKKDDRIDPEKLSLELEFEIPRSEIDSIILGPESTGFSKISDINSKQITLKKITAPRAKPTPQDKEILEGMLALSAELTGDAGEVVLESYLQETSSGIVPSGRPPGFESYIRQLIIQQDLLEILQAIKEDKAFTLVLLDDNFDGAASASAPEATEALAAFQIVEFLKSAGYPVTRAVELDKTGKAQSPGEHPRILYWRFHKYEKVKIVYAGGATLTPPGSHAVSAAGINMRRDGERAEAAGKYKLWMEKSFDRVDPPDPLTPESAAALIGVTQDQYTRMKEHHAKSVRQAPLAKRAHGSASSSFSSSGASYDAPDAPERQHASVAGARGAGGGSASSSFSSSSASYDAPDASERQHASVAGARGAGGGSASSSFSSSSGWPPAAAAGASDSGQGSAYGSSSTSNSSSVSSGSIASTSAAAPPPPLTFSTASLPRRSSATERAEAGAGAGVVVSREPDDASSSHSASSSRGQDASSSGASSLRQ